MSSELDRIIPPEIKDDEFYNLIQKLAQQEEIKTVLEIGSSSGTGSTEAFVRGLNQNPHQPSLFCMEVSQSRFQQLQTRYQHQDFVKCYNVSSVKLEQFPTAAEVERFYYQNQTGLNVFPLAQVLGWLRQDIEYIKGQSVDNNGIQLIKSEHNVEFFDLVLIDGSEFTGAAEFDQVYGAKFILLDDINTFKNYSNYRQLLADKNYRLIAENHHLRNGYAVFRKNRNSTNQNVDNFNYDSVAHEQKEQLLVKKLVKKAMTVFDVGANVGDYSILLSQLVGYFGQVYSFEPTSSSFSKLQQRIEDYNLSNIQAVQKAVFSETKDLEFHEFPERYSVWNSLGKPLMVDPYGNYSDHVPIVNTATVSGISLDDFCEQQGITRIDFLKIDVEGAESEVIQGAKQLLSNRSINFIQFEISQKMLEGLQKQAKEVFDLLNNCGYECHRINNIGEIGEEVTDSHSFYENYIAFPRLPVNFFTIVLNGEPFIRYHIEVFKQLPFPWHWHIVEGVADLKHDTAWSLELGGKIVDGIHNQGRSKDGTTEYLNQLAQEYPENITIYRQPEGAFWDGKLAMVNAPLEKINQECLLWQIDVDELWTVEQLCNGRNLFINHPDKTAAYYWCWYFVGENLVISTRNCYTQNPQQEWLRTWRFKPEYTWVAHEPPVLVEKTKTGEIKNIAQLNCFDHEQTEKSGLIFQHFAYVTPEQLKFKEQYYGYENAYSQWLELQQEIKFPVRLRQYFDWVRDLTMVDTATNCGVIPIAQKNANQEWLFLPGEKLQQEIAKQNQVDPVIVIDGVFFQLYETGIARLWQSLLEEWSANGFYKHLILLDRAGSAPDIPGIKYRVVPAYDYSQTDADRQMLQQICDQENADLFISTYYTTPVSTPSVFMAYDMIPEQLGWDLRDRMWQEKHYAISHACAYVAISENTAQDLIKFFPEINPDSVTVAPCGINHIFSPAKPEEINIFTTRYGITKPYFLLVGSNAGYKNPSLFFQAFSQLYSKQGFDVICTGGGGSLSPYLRQYAFGCTVHTLKLSDEELKAAYSGAIALVYPSLYEGFGLPILEAMACGCPVITCPNASIPEVAGEAVLYVQSNDVSELANALCEVQKPDVRQSLIKAGFKQAELFSWSQMANTVSSLLLKNAPASFHLQETNLIIFPDWEQPEEDLGRELQTVIREIANHPHKSNITLLIDTNGITEEDANLFLSSVAINLLMEEDLDVSEGPVIEIISNLSTTSWQNLLAHIEARIILTRENQQTISKLNADNIPVWEISKMVTF